MGSTKAWSVWPCHRVFKAWVLVVCSAKAWNVWLCHRVFRASVLSILHVRSLSVPQGVLSLADRFPIINIDYSCQNIDIWAKEVCVLGNASGDHPGALGCLRQPKPFFSRPSVNNTHRCAKDLQSNLVGDIWYLGFIWIYIYMFMDFYMD